MKTKLLCMSHTPLLNYAVTNEKISKKFYKSIENISNEIKSFDPTLILIYGPDHFNSFFYDNMPSICIGLNAHSIGDWNYTTKKINVPEHTSLSILKHCLENDIDISFSYKMPLDHAFIQPLSLLLKDNLCNIPVIPIFINCAAEPLPKMSRIINVGKIIGDYLKKLDERILIIGSGGLSHDPPTPQINSATTKVREFLISGRNPTQIERENREKKVIKVGQDIANGNSDISMNLNPSWDKLIIENYINQDFSFFEKMGDKFISEYGGKGGHEIRTWSAALASMSTIGNFEVELIQYDPAPEWLVAMGILKGQLK